jgi:hypothetical protein
MARITIIRKAPTLDNTLLSILFPKEALPKQPRSRYVTITSWEIITALIPIRICSNAPTIIHTQIWSGFSSNKYETSSNKSSETGNDLQNQRDHEKASRRFVYGMMFG